MRPDPDPPRMSSSRLGIFARNISSNLLGHLVNAVVMFILTPVILRELGTGTWGLWQLLIATTGSYGIFDLGIRSALGQYVTRYDAQQDQDAVNRSLSTALVMLAGLALLGLGATALIATHLPEFLQDRAKGLTGEALLAYGDEARHALLVIGCATSLALPLAVFQTVTYAKERMDLSNGLSILERLLVLGGCIWVLSLDLGMIGLAWVLAGAQLFIALCRMLLAYRLMPELRARPRLFSGAAIRELVSYGFYNSLVNAADRVVLATDAIVIVWVLNDVANGYYSAGDKLIPVYAQLVLAITWALTPYATALDARGDRAALLRLLDYGTRVSSYVAAVVGAGLLLVGKPFLALWLTDKPELVAGVEYTSSAHILHLLAIAALVRGAASCGRQVLFATREMRLLASLAGAEMLLNLGLSVFLVHSMGIEGVAWGTLIPTVLIYGVIQALAMRRRLQVPLGQLFGAKLRAILPTLLSMWATDLLLRDVLPGDTWTEIILRSVLLLVPAALVGYFIVLTPAERQRLLRRH